MGAPMQLLMLSAVAMFVRVVMPEMFSSTEEFRIVLEAQRNIASELKTYIVEEEDRLKRLKAVAEEFEKQGNKSDAEIYSFISNPVNAYHLAKKFQRDKLDFRPYMDNDEVAKPHIQRLESLRKMLPTQEDYEGSVAALMRLQDVYALPPATFAEGSLPGAQNTSRLSAFDCYEIGRVAYQSKDYFHTVMWMKEALDRLTTEESPGLDKFMILDYYSYATYMQGNLRHALALTEEMLILKPDHERARKNKAYFEHHINKEMELRSKGDVGIGETDDGIIHNERHIDEHRRSDDFKNYEALCRGEKVVEVKNDNRFTCDYARNNDPRLLIAPLRRETMHLNPWIMIYHNVIYDSEIEFLKKMAYPKLNRATVQTKSGELTTANYRITKSAWLDNSTDNDVMPRLLSRMSAMSQLNLETAEELQIANYGIGGHYEPHFDFARAEEIHAFGAARGNRIATILFYLSDVSAGGATVFTYLGLILSPEKGSAAFWMNLYRNGEGDLTLRHAACPVLIGNKWVANKWFHERGQELWHKCGTSPNSRFKMAHFETTTPTVQRVGGRKFT